METENTIHHRLLQLRDAAIVSESEGNSRLGYDCTTDALLALYNECSVIPSLSKTRDVSRFLKTYETAMEELQRLRLKEEDFDVVGVIGRGHFGEVRVVKEKSTNEIFAMKIMKKSHILQQADAAFFLEERDIMAYGQSQWLTKLHYAFQNNHSLYLVMDFHPGGDLFTIMERKDGGMSETEARFYISEIVAGLRDLHSLGFAHRDVKPDNVLIARSGHIKLVDFGSASRLDKQGNVVDMNIPVGTPEYISPEVLTSMDKKMEYGVCCDWWSLGIILYELLFNITPFEGDTITQTYANIMNHETSLEFPSDGEVALSGVAKDLIKSLLVSMNKRISYGDLLKHAFFTNTDWDNLDKSIPPYVPALNGPNDLSNFENFDEDSDDPASNIPAKPPRSFTGKELPFVGFSFMRWSESSVVDSATPTNDKPNVFTDLGNMANDIKVVLESTQVELKSAKERNSTLEKECVIYQSQLEDLQRMLDVERRNRRMSDSKALQLLSEIREQNKVAQNLREAQSKEANSKVEGAVTQLEEERLAAVKKAQRLREDLKKKSVELNTAVAKVNDLRAKLSKVMESSRKEIDSLQSKLSQVTNNSHSRIEELQKENFEVQDKAIKLQKEIEKLRTENTKQENKLNSIKLSNTLSTNEEIQLLKKQLSEVTTEKRAIEKKLEEALKNIDESSSKCSQLATRLKLTEGEVEELKRDNEQKELNEKKLRKEVESSKAEILRINREKRSLVTACDNLTAERDSINGMLRKKEKSIESLTNTKEFLESKINKLEILCSTQQDTSATDETVRTLQKHIDHLESERETLQGKVRLAEDASEKSRELEGVTKEKKRKITELETEIASLKESLSETTSSALRNGEKVTELSSIRKTLEAEVGNLKSSLVAQKEKAKQDILRAEALTKQMEDKYTELLAKVDKMEESSKDVTLGDTEKEVLLCKMAALESERDVAFMGEQKASKSLIDVKKKFESQELSVALMTRKITSLEDELADANAIIKEKNFSNQSIADEKAVIEQDLDVAEDKLESLTKQLNLEKEARKVLEAQSGDLRCRLEELNTSSNGELEMLRNELESHRQLSRQFSEKLAELQKEFGLKELYCKETERSLEVERALTAKLYDDLSTIGREHGKLKASYLKATKKVQTQEMELKEASREKEQALIEKATIEESMDLERNRLQTQLAQFNKLVEITPRVKTTATKTKGLKFRRKKRDPVKEMDEWKKMRKLAQEKGGILAGSDSIINSPGSQSSVSERLSLADQSISTSTNNELFKTPLNKPGELATPTDSIVSSSTTSSMKTRHKRTASNDAAAAASGYSTMTHNIPHRWVTKSSRFHKTHSCSACGDSIKHTQKFSKCSCCSVVCHLTCSDSMANTCGLPQSLALQMSTMSPPKKTRHEATPLAEDERESVALGNKENLHKIPRRLSIDLIRCQVSSTPTSLCSPVMTLPTGITATGTGTGTGMDDGNATELSITSSMLEDSEESAMEDLV